MSNLTAIAPFEFGQRKEDLTQLIVDLKVMLSDIEFIGYADLDRFHERFMRLYQMGGQIEFIAERLDSAFQEQELWREVSK